MGSIASLVGEVWDLCLMYHYSSVIQLLFAYSYTSLTTERTYRCISRGGGFIKWKL